MEEKVPEPMDEIDFLLRLAVLVEQAWYTRHRSGKEYISEDGSASEEKPLSSEGTRAGEGRNKMRIKNGFFT